MGTRLASASLRSIAAWALGLPVAIALLGVLIGWKLVADGVATPRPLQANFFHVGFGQYEVWFALGVAACLALVAAALSRFAGPGQGLDWATLLERLPHRPVVAVLVASAVAGAALVGALAFRHYPLSMDEVGMLFIADLVQNGTFEASIPEEWRGVAAGATPTFVYLDVAAGTWRSHYLPVFGSLLGVLRPVVDPWLVNPVLLGVALVATYASLRRMVGRSPEALLAFALFATSAQAVIVAGSMYAMTAHLAANSVWLWMTVADGPRTRWLRWLRPVVGFAAMGLHNFLPHVLFVLPFCVRDLRERRFALAAWHLVAYLAGLWYWMRWFAWSRPDVAEAATALLGLPGLSEWLNWVMADAALLSWTALPLVPLAIVGVARWRGLPPAAQDAALAVVLTSVAFLALRVDQGHGWGNRYLHGSLVGLPVVAAFGLRSLRDAAASSRVLGWSVSGLVLSVVVQIPLHAWQVREVVRPFAAATQAIRAVDADAVVLDERDAWYVADQVRNRPGLPERPVVFLRGRLDREGLDLLRVRFRTVELGPEALSAAGMHVREQP